MQEQKNGVRKYLIPALISVLLTCFLVGIGYNYANDSDTKKKVDCVEKDLAEERERSKVIDERQGKDIEYVREKVEKIEEKVEKIEDNTEQILRRLPR